MPNYLTPSPWRPPIGPLKPGRAALLWGESLRQVAAAAAAWGAARGRVLVVDAANRFDPYALVRQARAHGLAREAVLARVKVARAFTSHQLVRLIREELCRELTPGSLIIILGPVSLFYDEQVPLKERRRLFQEMVGLIAAIKQQAPLLLLQPPIPKKAANRHFGRLLAPVVDVRVEVGGEERKEKHVGGGPGDQRSPALPSNSPPSPL